MIDLETLDTLPSAVILSIGAVTFDPSSKTLGSKFYANTACPESINRQLQLGRTVSGETLSWWMRQSSEAQKVFREYDTSGGELNSSLLASLELEAHDLRSGLLALWKFISDNNPNTAIWSNGADFDLPILAHAYRGMGHAPPWPYRTARCYRTITNLGIGPRRPAATKGVKHNALDDAINQAEHLMEVLACINSH